jgi:hypothetical protein
MRNWSSTPVAWKNETDYGPAYSFSDDLVRAFPGILSVPEPSGSQVDERMVRRAYAAYLVATGDRKDAIRAALVAALRAEPKDQEREPD